MILLELLQKTWQIMVAHWQEFLLYAVIGVVVSGVFGLIVGRRASARKKYLIKMAQWKEMGYERMAVSPHGACIWLNRKENSLICARENTEKFQVIPYSSVVSFSLYDGDFQLAYGEMGKEMQYADWRQAKGIKSESFRMYIRLKDGTVKELLLCDSTIPRISHEYEETRRSAERFVAALVEVKAANEGEMGGEGESAREQEDPKASVETKLRLLKELYEKGLISEEQYNARCTEILSQI